MGWLLSHTPSWQHRTRPSHQADAVALITMACWAIGFLVGHRGVHRAVRAGCSGRDQTHEDELFLAGKDQGVARYFRFTTDHKVVGIQYLVVTMTLLGVGGTLAMLIRTDLISPELAASSARRPTTRSSGCTA